MKKKDEFFFIVSNNTTNYNNWFPEEFRQPQRIRQLTACARATFVQLSSTFVQTSLRVHVHAQQNRRVVEGCALLDYCVSDVPISSFVVHLR